LKIFTLIIFIVLNIFALDLPNSYKTTFKQEIKSPEGSIITYTGYLYVSKKDKKIKWEYLNPIEKYVYIVSEKKKTKIYTVEPDLEQVIVTSTDKINIINAILNINKEELTKENNIISKINNIEYKINFQIEDKKYIPIKINYLDDMENEVTIEFFNIDINKNIDSYFHFNIPDYYDLITR